MLRELTQNEINNVAGAGLITDVYPVIPAGYEIVGFSYQIVGWELAQTDYHLFDTVKYYNSVYDIQPIFAPIKYDVVTVVY